MQFSENTKMQYAPYKLVEAYSDPHVDVKKDNTRCGFCGGTPQQHSPGMMHEFTPTETYKFEPIVLEKQPTCEICKLLFGRNGRRRIQKDGLYYHEDCMNG